MVGLVPPVKVWPGPNVRTYCGCCGGLVPVIIGGLLFMVGHCGFLQHWGSAGSGIKTQFLLCSYWGHLQRENWISIIYDLLWLWCLTSLSTIFKLFVVYNIKKKKNQTNLHRIKWRRLISGKSAGIKNRSFCVALLSSFYMLLVVKICELSNYSD